MVRAGGACGGRAADPLFLLRVYRLLPSPPSRPCPPPPTTDAAALFALAARVAGVGVGVGGCGTELCVLNRIQYAARRAWWSRLLTQLGRHILAQRQQDEVARQHLRLCSRPSAMHPPRGAAGLQAIGGGQATPQPPSQAGADCCLPPPTQKNEAKPCHAACACMHHGHAAMQGGPGPHCRARTDSSVFCNTHREQQQGGWAPTSRGETGSRDSLHELSMSAP